MYSTTTTLTQWIEHRVTGAEFSVEWGRPRAANLWVDWQPHPASSRPARWSGQTRRCWLAPPAPVADTPPGNPAPPSACVGRAVKVINSAVQVCVCVCGVCGTLTFPISPWYNRSSWLGVKHQLTYLLTFPISLSPIWPWARIHLLIITITEMHWVHHCDLFHFHTE